MFKRIKRLFGKRNNAGFTLVEVVVSIALLGIMLVGVLGFTAPLLANVAEKKQDAHSVMLMEAIDSYIVNNVRNAKYLKIIANVPHTTDFTSYVSDMVSLATPDDKVCCISFQWVPTGMREEYKLVLMQDEVDASTKTITSSTRVMGDPIYDDLWIVPEFKMLPEKNEGENNIRAISNTMRVYKSPKCYSTDESTRKGATITYEGKSVNALTVIASQFVNKYDTSSGYKYKAYEKHDGFTYDPTSGLVNGGYDSSPGPIWTDDVGDTYYFPETYIFYVVRDLSKTTPTPTP